MKLIKRLLTFKDLNFIEDNKRGFDKIAFIKLRSIDFLCAYSNRSILMDANKDTDFLYYVGYRTNPNDIYSFDPLNIRNSNYVLTKEEVTNLMI